MASHVILPLGTEPAPADALVPNAGDWPLQAVFAHFDGTSAAVSWIPVLQILSSSGATVAEIPMDASVAAGASVKATWAPFLRGASAGGSAFTGLQYAYIDASNVTPASGVNLTGIDLPLAGFHTSDPATFAYNAFGGLHGIQFLKVGTYLVVAAGWFDSGGAVAGQFAQMDTFGGGDFLNELAIAPFVSFGGGDWEASPLYVNLQACTNPADLSQSVTLLRACENSAAGANLDCGLQAVYLSTATN